MKNQSALVSTKGSNFYQNYSTIDKHKTLKKYYYDNIPLGKQLPEWNQSSAVLRNSSSLYSIPKDKRFHQIKVNYYDHQKLNYPSTLNTRATSFGYGRKLNIPQAFRHNINTEGINAPFYEIQDITLRKSKSASLKRGKTIGPSWNSYSLVRPPHRVTVDCSDQVRANPGCKYIIAQQTGSQAQKKSMHGRLMMFTELRGNQTLSQPGPQNYELNQRQISRSVGKVNFGYSKKSDFTNNPQLASTPGPVYNISGFCDRFTSTKVKNFGKQWK